jgi:hypothetical protein
MKYLIGCLALGLALVACEEPVTTPVPSLLVEGNSPPEENLACRSVRGNLVLTSEGFDGTHFLFEFESHGDLEGTVFNAIVVDPPFTSLPNMVHVSGTGSWTITGSTAPELVGKVLITTVSGIGTRLTSVNVGHAFQHVVVDGARRGKIVQQERVEGESDSFPYHGQICP